MTRVLLKPHFLAIFALLLFSFFALKNLLIPEFYTSHDGENHVARAAQYYQALSDLQIPPRFAQSFYKGLGNPIFVYIYPLPYILTSTFHFIGFSFTDSFELLSALLFILSGYFTYLWLNLIFKDSKSAFLGALFYTFVPYRFLLIYVRASLSELCAYTFVPLAFYTLTKLSIDRNLKWLGISSISTALLLLSQNLVALFSLPILGAYIVLLSFFKRSASLFFKAATSMILGFGISSFTYLPSLFEREFVRFDSTTRQAYINHFVTLKQLIRSPWGYGFDLPGTVNDQMSFQIGLVHILVIAIILFLFILALLRRFSLINGLVKRFINKLNTQEYIFVFLFLITLFVSILLMVESQISVYIWQHFSPLQIVDIPWRFLGIASLSTTFLAAAAIKQIKTGIIFLILVFLVLFANRNHIRINEPRYLSDDFLLNYEDSATQYNEFTPKWRQTEKVPTDFDADKRIEIQKGNANISNLKSSAKEVSFQSHVVTDSTQIRINRVYFPKTDLYIDGQKTNFTITTNDNLDISKQQDSSGLIQFDLTKGNHQVDLKFTETTLRIFANYLSLLSILAAAFLIFKHVKN